MEMQVYVPNDSNVAERAIERFETRVLVDTMTLLGTTEPSQELLRLLDKATEIMVRTYQYGDRDDDWRRLRASIHKSIGPELTVYQGIMNPLVNMLHVLFNLTHYTLYGLTPPSLNKERDYTIEGLIIESITAHKVIIRLILVPLF